MEFQLEHHILQHFLNFFISKIKKIDFISKNNVKEKKLCHH